MRQPTQSQTQSVDHINLNHVFEWREDVVFYVFHGLATKQDECMKL